MCQLKGSEFISIVPDISPRKAAIYTHLHYRERLPYKRNRIRHIMRIHKDKSIIDVWDSLRSGQYAIIWDRRTQQLLNCMHNAKILDISY